MNTLTDFQNELMHFGIKGMHWGIRRYQPYPDGHSGGKFIGKKSKQRKQNVSREEEINSSIKKMNDDEINRKINRLRKENELKKLMTNDDSIKKAKKVIVKESGKVSSSTIKIITNKIANEIGNIAINTLFR